MDSICHGASLSIPGISKLNEFFEKDMVALMTLKGELIGLGTAKMNSARVLNDSNGLVITNTKIFMPAGTYKQ